MADTYYYNVYNGKRHGRGHQALGAGAPVSSHLKLAVVDKVLERLPASHLLKVLIIFHVEVAVEAVWTNSCHLKDERRPHLPRPGKIEVQLHWLRALHTCGSHSWEFLSLPYTTAPGDSSGERLHQPEPGVANSIGAGAVSTEIMATTSQVISI